jgi:hypothetical protein
MRIGIKPGQVGLSVMELYSRWREGRVLDLKVCGRMIRLAGLSASKPLPPWQQWLWLLISPPAINFR